MDIQKLKNKYAKITDEFENIPAPIMSNLNFIMMCEILDKLEEIAPTPIADEKVEIQEVKEKKVTAKKTTTTKK